MNEYEKYQLQWMLDHNHSIREMITRLGEIAFNEMSNDVGLSFDKIMDEAFEIFEYEQGFDNKEIWLCKDEWEHDLCSSNEYSLTDAGKTKVKHFIEDCRIKQDSILKAGLDTAKEMVNKPFELQDELTSARNRQKEINKILDTSGNENSKVVVEDEVEEERNESCMEL